ncbi:hypothetical protein EV646_103347 [Kribbella antiqua]|uniref:Uncharacterized protein n=1 Tax=Kribbella antiqua TaxID=2512217 RepID=A0A4R2IZL2_9ACTN|nr:hypothetical protein EV646_103347 [Kribbella antiqua]
MTWFITALKKYAVFNGTPTPNRYGDNPKPVSR